MTAAVLVSVVLPCHDEEGTVGACVEAAIAALRQTGVQSEVIVADNGSKDRSAERAAAAGARVIPVATPGYGAALLAGIGASQGQYIITADADGSHDLAQIGLFLSRLQDGYDLVIGNRFAGEIPPRPMKWLHRYVGSPLFSALIFMLFGTFIRDSQSGYRGFTRTAFERIKPRADGMEFTAKLLTGALLNRLRMCEVPVIQHATLRGRQSHFRSFRDGWRVLKTILLCRFCGR